MDALIAHDPQKLPMTARVKNTEDGVHLNPGDGFWRTALAKGSYRLFVTDPEAGQVAFLGTMREVNAPMPNPVIIAIRLKVENRQVSEIENIVVRDVQAANESGEAGRAQSCISGGDSGSAESLARRAGPCCRPVLIRTRKERRQEDPSLRRRLPARSERRPDHEQSGCGRPDDSAAGSRGRGGRGGPGKQPPAPPKPQGLQINITAMGCAEQFKLGYFNFIRRVRDRRFVAVDRERGLVMVIAEMDEPAGKYATFKLSDGREITAGPTRPTTIAAFEMYKIEGGKIRRIEAVQHDVPYGMLSGWSSYEDGMSSKARTQ